MSTQIFNPILPGFHPDPSILQVNGCYYIATSTFEWFPGVRIHRSTDLVNWDAIASPLSTPKHLDMLGNDFSDGIWAPCLSYHEGTFYLIFTNVRSSHKDPFKDTSNYITSAHDINGPWSEPVFLNCSGFDPSLFHDDDGRKWLVNMEWDYRKEGRGKFGGILLQEYDEVQKELKGEIYRIFKNTPCGITEGPHLYKKDGYYYLVMAEGGTGYMHAVSVARSRSITGPYQVHPQNPVLTSWNWDFTSPDLGSRAAITLQKAGHASICQSADKKYWYMVHLCGRPLPGTDRCVLGRETCIQEIEWREDGWFYLKQKGNKPADYIEIEENIRKKPKSRKYYFDDSSILNNFQTLRVPLPQNYFSFTKKPGFLALRGGESIYSRFHQSLLAIRQEDFCFHASVVFDFTPESYMHMAGLIYRYNEDNQYYLFKSYDEDRDSYSVNLVEINNGNYTLLKQNHVSSDLLEFRVEVCNRDAQFYFTQNNISSKIGPVVDVSILSDEYADPDGFTGSFIGFCIQDLAAHKKEAYFKEFIYQAE